MAVKGFRLSIERMRALVLVGGGVLVVAIATVLVVGHLKRRFLHIDLPKRLGADIQVQSDGFDYTQTSKGKTIFKIHAARAVELKGGDKALLHDVRIELYGEDGSRTDTIAGAEFSYDKDAGQAEAVGPVEITLMRPGVRPAIAAEVPGAGKDAGKAVPAGKPADGIVGKVPALVGQMADGQIHVKTSGLRFDQKTGRATTAERLDFAVSQASGSAIGADYDSGSGQLVLDHAVAMRVMRPNGVVTVHAAHAEFAREDQSCRMRQAEAEYSGGSADFAEAVVHFRADGSVEQLDGSGGVELKTATGSQMDAPTGHLEFDGQNQPTHGVMEGGTRLSSSQAGRVSTGAAPRLVVEFAKGGEVKSAHLEKGVSFTSRQTVETAHGERTVRRTWQSQVADIAFVAVKAGKVAGAAVGRGKVEPSRIEGFGGVQLTDEGSGSGGGAARMSADHMVASLGPEMELTRLDGNGHASFAQRTSSGADESSASEELTVHFAPVMAKGGASQKGQSRAGQVQAAQIESVLQTGNVVLVETPGSAGGNPLRATSARLDYDGVSEIANLTGGDTAPRVRSGGLDLTATRIDVNRVSGDAWAHGAVKASWSGSVDGKTGGMPGAGLLGGGGDGGPAHVVAADAELHQATGEATFRGDARLWREGNSVAAPVIVLNRSRETLHAESNGTAVRTVLVSAGSKTRGANVLRVRSGQLDYSDGERLARFAGAAGGQVVAEESLATGTVTVASERVEVLLLPAGVHGAGGSASGVDRMTAVEHVTVNFPGRKGFGEKLVYTGDDGSFRLTGSSAAPPRIVDQARGTVTGSTLVFHSGDQSVEVEGDGGKTVTETRTPR
jgi:lipopolysaccharide export system protein LptA